MRILSLMIVMSLFVVQFAVADDNIIAGTMSLQTAIESLKEIAQERAQAMADFIATSYSYNPIGSNQAEVHAKVVADEIDANLSVSMPIENDASPESDADQSFSPPEFPELPQSDSLGVGLYCIQVITSATNPETGECREFATPCNVPEGWVVDWSFGMCGADNEMIEELPFQEPLALPESNPYEEVSDSGTRNRLMCIQVLTPALNPDTGECKVFPTPCEVPQEWVKNGCESGELS